MIQASELEIERGKVGEMLRVRYGIDSEFVRVATLSKVLGIAAPTIYSQMRSGTFFLPYRHLSSMPAVKFGDLVDWYCSTQGENHQESSELPKEIIEFGSPEAERGRKVSADLIALALQKMKSRKPRSHQIMGS